jgi:hypothetical protein
LVAFFPHAHLIAVENQVCVELNHFTLEIRRQYSPMSPRLSMSYAEIVWGSTNKIFDNNTPAETTPKDRGLPLIRA